MGQDPFRVQLAVSARYIEATVEFEEEIAQVASTLTRADDSWSRDVWMKLVEEEELYFSVNLILCYFLAGGRHQNLNWLYLDVFENPACPIPGSTDELQ